MTVAKAFAIASAFAVVSPVATWAQSAPHEPVAFQFGAIEFLGDTPDTTTLGVGGFNVLGDNGSEVAAELRLEYRYGGKWLSLGPIAGIMANSDAGVFGYAGLYTDMRIADRWILTPAAGIAAYDRSNGKDLGGTFQFHLGLDVAYRFGNGGRLGLKFAHISNSDLNGKNPGAESLLLTYTLFLGGRR